MKDEIITIVIFILLITLFVYNSVTIDRCSDMLIKEIETAKENAYNDDASKYFEAVYKRWGKEKKKLFYISAHNTIWQIDENIIMGCEYVLSGDKERAIYNFKKAGLLLEDLNEKEKIRLDNIF